MTRKLLLASFAAGLGLISTASHAATETLVGDVFSIDWTSNLGAPTLLDYSGREYAMTWIRQSANDGTVSIASKFSPGASPEPIGFMALSASFDIIAPLDPQIRFSYWHFESTVSISNAVTGEVISTQSFSKYGQESLHSRIYGQTTQFMSIPELRLDATYKLIPGSVLTPSLDASCQSLACMNLETDRASVSIGAFVSLYPVPEPTTGSMMLAGVSALLLGARRKFSK